jgi:ureidoglycolate lyase
MIDRTITVEVATPENVAPYGHYVGAHKDVAEFARWDSVVVYGPIPIKVESGGELLHVQMGAATFPARVMLLERHAHHTQTYLPTNAKPYVMTLGRETVDGMPDLTSLRAFLFEDGAGIAMHADTWHEFPLALEDDTRFTVILRDESHHNTLDAPEHPMDAKSPDLERFDMKARARVYIAL